MGNINLRTQPADSSNFLLKWVCPQWPYYTAKFLLCTNTGIHSLTHSHIPICSSGWGSLCSVLTFFQSTYWFNPSVAWANLFPVRQFSGHEAASCQTILVFMVWYLQLHHKICWEIKFCLWLRFSTRAHFYGPIILISILLSVHRWIIIPVTFSSWRCFMIF